MPLPTIPASPQGRRSMPPPLRLQDGPQGQGQATSPPLFAEPKRKRTTSFKKALRQSAEIASQWKDGLVPRSPSFASDPTRPPFLGIGKRQNSASSGVSSSGLSHASYTAAMGYERSSSRASRDGHRGRDEDALRRVTEDGSTAIATPIAGGHEGINTGDNTPTPGDRSFGSWIEVEDGQGQVLGHGHDGEIEKRVMEMAGLGLGSSPSSAHRYPSDRRVKSESRTKHTGGMQSSATHAYLAPPNGLAGGGEMTRSRSADIHSSSSMSANSARTSMDRGPGGETLDMETLRMVAGRRENAVCADCGKSTRQSRWASICKSNPGKLYPAT